VGNCLFERGGSWSLCVVLELRLPRPLDGRLVFRLQWPADANIGDCKRISEHLIKRRDLYEAVMLSANGTLMVQHNRMWMHSRTLVDLADLLLSLKHGRSVELMSAERDDVCEESDTSTHEKGLDRNCYRYDATIPLFLMVQHRRPSVLCVAGADWPASPGTRMSFFWLQLRG
jgi:hypothetical protein